jgi:quinol monooxygenase YgiN
MYTVTGNWYVREGCVEEARRALRELAEKVRSEEGTLVYLVHEQAAGLPPAAPRTIAFIEIYTNKHAFDAHIGGATFKTFMATHKNLFVADPQGNPFIEFASLDRLAGFVRHGAVTR